MTSQTPRASLLERAAEIYDFGAALRARPGAAAAEEAPVAAPAEEPLAPADAPVGGRYGAVDRELLAEAGFLAPDASVSVLAEEFRIVKRQLLLTAMGEDRGAKARTILIASGAANEGKSFCAVNLALSMAQERDTELLLVDADVAQPEILSLLGLEAGPGLIDALADPALDPEDCVIRTDVPGLSVLPAGRQSNEATELFASDRTRVVLDRLAERPGRLILLDSPPVLAASPASVLALHAGQVVLVVRADRTSEAELRETVALLKGCGDIKLLLNAVSFGPGGRRFGSYYGYGG